MEDYKFVEKIGSGSHGTAYLLKSKEDKCVVCKSIIGKYKSHAYREISILSKLKHRRVLKLIDSVVLGNSVFLILEHMNYGSLESMITFFSRSLVTPSANLGWSIMSQVADALNYIHSKKIIHRDVKPSNVLVSRFCANNREFLEFKLCDFSLSTRSDGLVEDRHAVGTPFYMAPEIISRSRYDSTVDCWGLGCCVYEVLSLKKPFHGATRKELFQDIVEKEITESISADKSLDSLIKLCLRKSNRITAKSIIKDENIRLSLAMLEIKLKESRIEELEKKLDELRNVRETVIK